MSRLISVLDTVNTKVLIDITTYGVLGGYLPPITFGLVMEWVSLHKDKLLRNWEAAKQGKPLPEWVTK